MIKKIKKLFYTILIAIYDWQFLDNMPTVVTTDANQNRYITMMPENVKALYSMIIELEEYNKNISELISRIRNHMNYFKN